MKETFKQQYLVNVKDNGFWARHLIQSVQNDSDPMRILTFEKRLAELKPQDVQAIAKKYLDPEKYVQLVLNPEK